MRNPVQSKLIAAGLLASLALPTSAWCVEDPEIRIGYLASSRARPPAFSS
jgi:hypothetical protein